jgi:hypothetical protein
MIKHGIKLSENQKRKLRNGHTVRLTHSSLNGPTEIMLTDAQSKKIQRAQKAGKGCDLRLSESQISMQGGSLWDSLKKGAKWLASNETVRGVASNVGKRALDRIVPVVESKATDLVNRGLTKVGLGTRNRFQKIPNVTLEEMQRGEGFFSDLAGAVGNTFVSAIPKVGNLLLDKGIKVDVIPTVINNFIFNKKKNL